MCGPKGFIGRSSENDSAHFHERLWSLLIHSTKNTHHKIIILRVKRHHCNSVFCHVKLGWRNLLKKENKPTQSYVGLLNVSPR
jgi:hypothetical protein